MGQQDFPESFERRLPPGNGQETIVGRLYDIVRRFNRPWTFFGLSRTAKRFSWTSTRSIHSAIAL
jgi:hypothetical protein